MKKGKVVTSWKRRFFVLTSRSLTDFPRPDGKCLGAIPIREVRSVEQDLNDRDLCFALNTSTRKYLLQVDDEKQLSEWMDDILSASVGSPAPLPLCGLPPH